MGTVIEFPPWLQNFHNVCYIPTCHEYTTFWEKIRKNVCLNGLLISKETRGVVWGET